MTKDTIATNFFLDCIIRQERQKWFGPKLRESIACIKAIVEEDTRENCSGDSKDEEGKSGEVGEDISFAFLSSRQVMAAGESDTEEVEGGGDGVSDCGGEKDILVSSHDRP